MDLLRNGLERCTGVTWGPKLLSPVLLVGVGVATVNTAVRVEIMSSLSGGEELCACPTWEGPTVTGGT